MIDFTKSMAIPPMVKTVGFFAILFVKGRVLSIES